MDLAESLAHRPTHEERHPWEQVRFEFLYSHLQQQVSLAPDSIVIDIGCGDAYVVEQLAMLHPECQFFTIDPAFTEEHLQYLRTVLSVENIQFFRYQEEILSITAGKTAALVLLMDVIEHIEDDNAFLQLLQTRPFIDTSTTFFITVPAFQTIYTHRDRLLGHYRRYTKNQLRILLQRNGFRALESGYFFLFPFLGRSVSSLAQRVLPTVQSTASNGSLHWNRSIWLRKVMRSLLRFDLSLSNRFLSKVGLNRLGLSVYCIAKKI